MATEGPLTALEEFADLVAQPDPGLDDGAILIAAAARPQLDRAGVRLELDRMAAGVTDLDSLVQRLFVEESFVGNLEEYDDPRNSLLDQVLARRLGIPISLSVVVLEVGRRAGIALEGVGMPGHFLTRPAGEQRYLDAFGGGRLLGLDQCEAIFRTVTGAGPEIDFSAELLPTVGTPVILARILENLRVVYRRQGATEDLEWVLRMRLVLPEADAGHVQQLSQAVAAQGRWDEGAVLLDGYARTWPAQAEALTLAARKMRAHLN